MSTHRKSRAKFDSIWHGLNLRHDHRLEEYSIIFRGLNSQLTRTESRVLGMVAYGFDTIEIATMLHVSIHAVENYRHNTRRKLGLARSSNLREFLEQALQRSQTKSNNLVRLSVSIPK